MVLDGEDVTAAIRSPETSRASSLVSVHPGVRTEMVARQREMGREGKVVLDGRDIGTAVFPDAEVKFFLDATPGERAHRRHDELRAAGSDVTLEKVEEDVRERDYTDSHRAESPLVRAWDALTLDTTRLGPDRGPGADARRGAGPGGRSRSTSGRWPRSTARWPAATSRSCAPRP